MLSNMTSNTDEFTLIAPNACPSTKASFEITESNYAGGGIFWMPPKFSPNNDGNNDTCGARMPLIMQILHMRYCRYFLMMVEWYLRRN